MESLRKLMRKACVDSATIEKLYYSYDAVAARDS